MKRAFFLMFLKLKVEIFFPHLEPVAMAQFRMKKNKFGCDMFVLTAHESCFFFAFAVTGLLL
jgi:hypothetical protein